MVKNYYQLYYMLLKGSIKIRTEKSVLVLSDINFVSEFIVKYQFWWYDDSRSHTEMV